MSENLDAMREVEPGAGGRGVPESVALSAPRTDGCTARTRQTRPRTAHLAPRGPRARGSGPASRVASGAGAVSTPSPAAKATEDESTAVDMDRTARVLAALLSMLRHLAEQVNPTSI